MNSLKSVKICTLNHRTRAQYSVSATVPTYSFADTNTSQVKNKTGNLNTNNIEMQTQLCARILSRIYSYRLFKLESTIHSYLFL